MQAHDCTCTTHAARNYLFQVIHSFDLVYLALQPSFQYFFFIHYPFHEVIALLEPGNRFYIIVFCLYNLTRSFMVVDIIVLDKQSAIFETKTTTESTRSFKTRSLFIFQSSNSIKWNAPPKYRRGTA